MEREIRNLVQAIKDGVSAVSIRDALLELETRAIVLLAGGGNTAHVFGDFAPKLRRRRLQRS